MTARKPIPATRTPRQASRVAVTLGAGACWLGVLVLGAGAGLALVNPASGGGLAGAVLVIALACAAGVVTFRSSGRTWLLVLTVVCTILYGVAVAMTCVGYVAVHGERYTATVVSSECHQARFGTACTARCARPDGTPLDEDVSVDSKLVPGTAVDLAEDRAGIVETRTAADAGELTFGALLAAAGAIVLAVLFGLAARLRIRYPDRPGKHSRRR
ncbi:hypothetical protein G3I59_34015 [Amycolatopsis rubida]|uniref:Integral membrane protein n=1 Tax=Amycolatopsis rubida TaxID=112413 RepID=A0ABX0C4X3_9PSEU|nr:MULTISPECIES: hypothetical protein [Amycolatopsis]MYW95478.1 hypothetical protein [Amycolatopsis rubida]NEC60467.1 hypothetical protein [Amycolatopsis rubida]OAP22722.1 hypothetical protein A4R44_06596 [Amycolatopsis sp. M39]